MGGTLLLADDSITIQKVVELTFAETEHSVVAVGNGRDLLARVESVRPDVVLCDVVMPDLNGYEICQRLKSEPATLHIPVILLTGTFEPFDRDRALAAGCDAIVTKPFEAKELIATVEELLHRSRTLGAAGLGEAPGVGGELGVPHGVEGIDFTTTGFERMVAAPPPPDLPPAEGIEITTSSFRSQVSAPVPPPPPELGEASGIEFAGATPAEGAAVFGEDGPEVLTASPEDQTTPSGPVPTAAERQLAAMALLEEVERRSELAETPPAAGARVASGEAGGAKVEIEPPFAPPPPEWGAPSEPEAMRETPPPAAAAGPPAMAAAAVAAPRELSQDEVDRIARRVLELAQPLIERIAWEVIPDMAEMIVRQRVRELEEAAEDES